MPQQSDWLIPGADMQAAPAARTDIRVTAQEEEQSETTDIDLVDGHARSSMQRAWRWSGFFG